MIIGVHGIAQQQHGRSQLLGEWTPALSDGLERAIGRPPTTPTLDLAFYGHLFLKPGGDGTKAPVADDLLDDLDAAEAGDLAEAAAENLTADDLEYGEKAPSKGGGVPGPLRAVLAALERRFGATAGVLYLGELRQVRRYLTDTDLKDQVDQIVDDQMAAGARILIGHSLGSVVAYEFVRRHPEHELDAFLTLGSPLALRMVRSRLPQGSGAAPSRVRRWVNVRDPKDPVTLGGDLATFWPGVDDRHVDNGNSPHAVTRYLGKQIVGSVVSEADPGVAGS